MAADADRRIEYRRLPSEDSDPGEAIANERIGKLVEFLDRLPSDVVFMVMRHLQPIEVFHLCRNSGKEEYMMLSNEVFRQLCVKNKVPKLYNRSNWEQTFKEFLTHVSLSVKYQYPYDFNTELSKNISSGARKFEFIVHYYDNYGQMDNMRLKPLGSDLMPTVNGIINMKNKIVTVALGSVNIKALLDRDDIPLDSHTIQVSIHPPSMTLGHDSCTSMTIFLDKDCKLYYIDKDTVNDGQPYAVYCQDLQIMNSSSEWLFSLDRSSSYCMTVHEGSVYVLSDRVLGFAGGLSLLKYNIESNIIEEIVCDTVVKFERIHMMGNKLISLYRQGISVFSLPEEQLGVFRLTDTIFSGCRPHILNDDTILYTSEILSEQGKEVWVKALIRRDRGLMVKDVARGLSKCFISVISPYMFNIVTKDRRMIMYYEDCEKGFLILHTENIEQEPTSGNLGSFFKKLVTIAK